MWRIRAVFSTLLFSQNLPSKMFDSAQFSVSFGVLQIRLLQIIVDYFRI